MRTVNVLITGIAVFLLSTCRVDALKCFQCDSTDRGCSSLTEADVNSEFLKECGTDQHYTFCRKTIQTILSSNNLLRITRSCGWLTTYANETKCIENDTQFKFDITCQCYTDGCNSAPSSAKTSAALLTTLFILLRVAF